MARSEVQRSEYLVAAIRYVPDPMQINSVCIAVLMVGTLFEGRVFVRRLSNWGSVLRLDPNADIPLVVGILEELERMCRKDPGVLESAADWENAIQIFPLLHLATATPEQGLDTLFRLYCMEEDQ